MDDQADGGVQQPVVQGGGFGLGRRPSPVSLLSADESLYAGVHPVAGLKALDLPAAGGGGDHLVAVGVVLL
ncbi:hypothetical protein [Mycobacterium sp.]|uniref:hypothetical protein n=1 Tax=Mycobacterium sp. TaxID=1785 RepID=UPI0031E12CE8